MCRRTADLIDRHHSAILDASMDGATIETQTGTGTDKGDSTVDGFSGGTILIPRTLIPTVGHLIFFRDPEGNAVGAMQYDSNAQDEI